MDNFNKSLAILEEAIDVLNQLQPLLSQNGFELKKWINNNDVDTEAIPEILKSIRDTKQEEMDLNTERFLVLGIKWCVTVNYL